MNTPHLTSLKIDFSQFMPGYTPAHGGGVFRVYVPKATLVELVVFEDYKSESGTFYTMKKDDGGMWNRFLSQDLKGKWYAYNLIYPDDILDDSFMDTDELIADPWSRFVTSTNHHLQYHKTRIPTENSFDWDGDTFVSPEDPRDLIIYETHIKDMVAHPSAETYVQGIYNDFREAKTGGIKHLKRLGVNAVEFLPLQKFPYFEPPFNQLTEEGVKNSWNHYARNYWGYMTSFFMAPETIYASDAELNEGAVIGYSEKAASELKNLVNALHEEDITVIMDVVYNHASHYDLNPLKYTAKDHYFRLDDKGNFKNDSWTGNDIDTSAEYSRKLIVESVKHWMKEYHIDGFRFDLAGLIDWETVDLIREEAEKINPNVVLIAEPWGGEYKPDGYSDHGWASWNDHLRNNFKGYDPLQDKGYMFGNLNPHTSRYAIENFIRGTLKHADQGLFNSSEHSVNYIESHDGYTLGDYIRIVLDPDKIVQKFSDKESLTSLNEAEEGLARFSALCLFVSQGITMIHAGQEWARSKVIAENEAGDPKTGQIDRDTYNKDNATNWLNFDEIELNKELFSYYKGLIEMRLATPALRKANPEEIDFKVYKDPLHVTFSIDGKSTSDKYDYFISLNANTAQSHEIILPDGYWEMIVNENEAGSKTIRTVEHSYILPPSSGVVLRKLRVNNA